LFGRERARGVKLQGESFQHGAILRGAAGVRN